MQRRFAVRIGRPLRRVRRPRSESVAICRSVPQAAELVRLLVARLTQRHDRPPGRCPRSRRPGFRGTRTRPRPRVAFPRVQRVLPGRLTRAGMLPCRRRSFRLRSTVTVMPTTMNHSGMPSSRQDRPDHVSTSLPLVGGRATAGGCVGASSERLRLEQGQPQVGQPAHHCLQPRLIDDLAGEGGDSVATREGHPGEGRRHMVAKLTFDGQAIDLRHPCCKHVPRAVDGPGCGPTSPG